MSYQRRAGLPATLYCSKVQADNRGNDVEVPDMGHSHSVKAWTYPQRSAKAEVPGQQKINVTRIGVPLVDDAGVTIERLTLWSRVLYMGKVWDLVVPPQYHHGTRHTRHWSLTIKERPGG